MNKISLKIALKYTEIFQKEYPKRDLHEITEALANEIEQAIQVQAKVKTACGYCKDCEHFGRLKEYNNVGSCWNDEVNKLLDGRDILWNENFGCMFYKSKSV